MRFSQEQFNAIIYYAVQSYRVGRNLDRVEDAINLAFIAKQYYNAVASNYSVSPVMSRTINNQIQQLFSPGFVWRLPIGVSNRITDIPISSEATLIDELVTALNLKQSLDAPRLNYTYTESSRPSFSRYFIDVYGNNMKLGFAIACIGALAMLIAPTFTLYAAAVVGLGLLTSGVGPCLFNFFKLPGHAEPVAEEHVTLNEGNGSNNPSWMRETT